MKMMLNPILSIKLIVSLSSNNFILFNLYSFVIYIAYKNNKSNQMKYPIDTVVMINNCEWRVAEFRMGRGREWVYTLSFEDTDGSFETMRLNETAIGKIRSTESQGEDPIEETEEAFA